MKTTLIGLAVGILFGVAAAEAQDAQDWVRPMFDGVSHDFGTVARGAKVEYRFTVENIYEEDAHIASVSSSCGCTTPTLTKQGLKTWEKSEIVVSIDTRNEPGRKEATITVTFDKPFPREIQLHVYANIRGDIVLQPGAVQFGTVNQGVSASRTCRISYAGRDDWRIERVECANPHLEAGAVETSRQPGQVEYNLTVELKSDAPSGYVQGPLMLVTNDFNAGANRVPVAIEGYVAPALTVRPGSLSFGMVEPGKPATQNLVVQGRVPFRVLAVHSTDARFQCKLPTESKIFHILPITFQADAKIPTSGAISARLSIETDIPGVKPVEIDVSAQHAPPKGP
jgi:hypothetical protein